MTAGTTDHPPPIIAHIAPHRPLIDVVFVAFVLNRPLSHELFLRHSGFYNI